VVFKRLAGIIQRGQEAGLSAALAAFACRDRDVENFLKTKAIEHERRKKSRTYLLFDEIGEHRILAYFTLSLKILTFGQSLSKSSIQKIDGFNKNAKAAPVFLIGQFGKDAEAKDLSGSAVMSLCLYQLKQTQNNVGGRAVLAECLPIPAVMDFYIRNGFTLLQEDEGDKYQQMILML
jgi:hypothetical protein